MKRFRDAVGLQVVLLTLALYGIVFAADSTRLTPEQQTKLAEAQKFNGQAVELFNQGKYAEAEKLCRQALEIDETYVGADHPHTAQVLNNLGLLAETQLRYAEAVPLYERALNIREKTVGPNHLDVAVTLRNIAGLDEHLGRYDQSEKLYLRALSIFENVRGPNHLDVESCLNDLAVLYDDEGRYSQAEPLLERSLKICMSRLGPDDPKLATGLHNLAFNCESQGKCDLAEAFFRRALEIQEKAFGPNHPEVASTLCGLATVCRDQQQFAKAEPLCRRALQIDQQAGGTDSPNVARDLNDLGQVIECQGKYDEAEPLYQRALKIQETLLGPDHLSLAVYLNNLGELKCLLGQFDAADEYLQRAMKIRKAALGPDHPDVALSAGNLSGVQSASGRWRQAAESFDEERHIIRRHIAHVLPALSPSQQTRFLRKTDEGELFGCLSMGLKKCDDQKIVDLSADWLLNGKAVTQEALAQNAQLARDSADPRTTEAVKELLEIRRQLASLIYAGPEPGQEEQRKSHVDDLQEREAELARQIAQAHGEVFQNDPWVDLSAVRSAISTDTVLVDIAKFDAFDFQAKTQDKKFLGYRYAAWIIPPGGRGTIAIVDLGEAEKIDAAVAAVGKEMQTAVHDPGSVRRRKTDVDAAPELGIKAALAKVSRLVLAPVLEKIPDDTKQLIVSPDSHLWLVPWAALPLDDDRYAIEQYQIRYSISGRDLISRPAINQATTKPVVMADPNYDLTPNQIADSTRSVLRGLAANHGSAELRSLVGSTSLTSVLPKVRRLPGTKAEADAIVPRIARYTHQEPVVYTDRWALEGVFKELHAPRLLVMSTHGFFLRDQVAKLDGTDVDPHRSAAPVLTVGGEPVENPLLRCGLLLAGCNSRGRQITNGERTNLPTDDGILTGMEIVGADLRGTELVVLSACETALGEVQNGEGVSGLRQAFQLAGAQAVVATLWQIPDVESAEIMGRFFDGLSAGQSKAEALRQAQLDQIKSLRQRYSSAHPYFWAAYTLTGE
jgi:CHAT domain-containing protein/Tfp pilus assembly protein PilF